MLKVYPWGIGEEKEENCSLVMVFVQKISTKTRTRDVHLVNKSMLNDCSHISRAKKSFLFRNSRTSPPTHSKKIPSKNIKNLANKSMINFLISFVIHDSCCLPTHTNVSHPRQASASHPLTLFTVSQPFSFNFKFTRKPLILRKEIKNIISCFAKKRRRRRQNIEKRWKKRNNFSLSRHEAWGGRRNFHFYLLHAYLMTQWKIQIFASNKTFACNLSSKAGDVCFYPRIFLPLKVSTFPLVPTHSAPLMCCRDAGGGTASEIINLNIMPDNEIKISMGNSVNSSEIFIILSPLLSPLGRLRAGKLFTCEIENR